jgi:hypothetical protein
MSARTPEGKLKERCRKLARDKLKLFWANVEGKGFNGFPDTEVGKYPRGSGIFHLEAKRADKVCTQEDFERLYPQQWKRIREIRAAGGEADWYNSFERFCELIGYDLSL